MKPMIIAWELTRRCGLQCRHCRAASTDQEYTNELTTAECLRTVDAISRLCTPMFILTGGEPLRRKDVFEIAREITDRGCRVVLATCGHLLTDPVVARLQASGVSAVSVSLDAATAAAHDRFRGVQGAYDKTLAGLQHLRAAGMPFQINTTVCTLNVQELPQILENAIDLGAAAMDFFFLVPTGRGAQMAAQALTDVARDEALQWIARQEREAPIRIRTTCSPSYRNFRLPAKPGTPQAPFHGCMGGRGFVFISHTGRLQPCGFLDLEAGDLRTADFDFARLYENAPVFQTMRSLDPFTECPARGFARASAVETYGSRRTPTVIV
jgi:MoaA/NifB/PqqE/SkfB family radical SAM enzyme